MKLVTDKREAFRLQSHGSIRETIYDVVLDDGTYLPETLAIDDCALGIIVGLQTGVASFSEVPELRGRSIAHALRLRCYHRVPILGDLLRAFWLRRTGVETREPEWRPKF